METPTTTTTRATHPHPHPRTRTLTRQARNKIAAWLAKRVRNFPRNTTDPITLETLTTPVFKHVHPLTGFVYGFQPETLATYFTTSENFTHPLTREPFNVVEVRRLTKLLPPATRTPLIALFLQTRDANSSADDASATETAVYPVSFIFNLLAPVPSVFSIVACMLDIARLEYLHSEVFNGNINDVVSVYVFILLPMLHNQFYRDDDAANHCLYLLHHAVYIVNAIRSSEEGAEVPVYNAELLGIISHILAQFLHPPAHP